jgi:hypothetical protein
MLRAGPLLRANVLRVSRLISSPIRALSTSPSSATKQVNGSHTSGGSKDGISSDTPLKIDVYDLGARLGNVIRNENPYLYNEIEKLRLLSRDVTQMCHFLYVAVLDPFMRVHYNRDENNPAILIDGRHCSK